LVKIDYKTANINHVLIRLYINDNEMALSAIEWVKANGYSEKGILYAFSKKDVQDKIDKYRADPRFRSILINEIKKYAKKGWT